MTVSTAPRDSTTAESLRWTVLLAAGFWSCAFLINEGMSTLRGELPFAIAGGHRIAAFAFGALLAVATAYLLHRAGPDSRRQLMLAAGTILVMPVLHAIFFFLTCKVAPISGVAPMTLQECVLKGLLSTGYFAAWVALQLAVIYRTEARQQRPALVSPAIPAAELAADRCYWASWRNQRVRIAADEIRWVEAQKDYAILHCSARSCIMRATLGSLAADLPAQDFVRVHRSAIVRRSVIASIYRKPTGALALRTRCGAELPVGRSYAHALRQPTFVADR